MTVHCCDSLYVIEWSGYTEADQKAKRGMKKPTQPTIAHDETHEAGELISCPLWNCKSTNIPSKTKKLLLLT